MDHTVFLVLHTQILLLIWKIAFLLSTLLPNQIVTLLSHYVIDTVICMDYVRRWIYQVSNDSLIIKYTPIPRRSFMKKKLLSTVTCRDTFNRFYSICLRTGCFFRSTSAIWRSVRRIKHWTGYWLSNRCSWRWNHWRCYWFLF